MKYVGHRGERKCPTCGKWTSWLAAKPDGTCEPCQREAIKIANMVANGKEIVFVLK